MADYYVDITAAVDGTGTIGDPWNTVKGHVDDLAAGDTMHLRGTNTRPGEAIAETVVIDAAGGCVSGTAVNPITVKNYTDEYVKFTQENPGDDNIKIDGLDYWVIDGQDTNYRIEIDKGGSGGRGIFIVGGAANNNTVRYVEVHNGALYGVDINDADYTTIAYCKIHTLNAGASTDAHGVFLRGDASDTVIEHCEIYDCRGDCIQFSSAAGKTDNIIRHNDLYVNAAVASCCENAVDLKHGTDTLVYGNAMHGFRDCDGSCGGTGADGEAIVVHTAHSGLVAYDNEIYDISGAAIAAQGNMTFRHNVIHDLVWEASVNEKNVIYCRNAGVTYNIYNNTVVGKYASGTNVMRFLDNTIVVIKNNIFEDTANIQEGVGVAKTYNNNGWFNADQTLAGVGDVTDTTADFVDKSGDDYNLAATSPCIDAGVDLGYPYEGSAPDLGALEYVGDGDGDGVAAGGAPMIIVSAGLALVGHELYLTDDKGVRLSGSGNPLATFLWFRATRVANGVGWIDVAVPKSFNADLFLNRDYMIQLWRRPGGGALSLWRPYFLRKWRRRKIRGVETLVLSGPCVNELLRRRWVAAYSGTSWAEKTDYADDMMKIILTETTQAPADVVQPLPAAGTRVWSSLSVAADLGAAPIVSKDMAFDGPLLTRSGGGVLPSIAAASRVAGTDLFFDIVVSSISATSIAFEFRTYTGQPGQDLSGYVLFDESRGNMDDVSYEYDASEEVNYVYGAGRGEGTARNVQQVYDADRYNVSAWNRCEAVADARNDDSDDGVREKARAALRAGEPMQRFSAALKDVAQTRYGVHWGWGDRVRARAWGMEFVSVVNSVMLTVDKKKGEQVTARMDYISDV